MGFKDFFKWLDNHARESNDWDHRVYLDHERERKEEKERRDRIYYSLEDIPSYKSYISGCADCHYLHHTYKEYRCSWHNIKLTDDDERIAFRILSSKRCNHFKEG